MSNETNCKENSLKLDTFITKEMFLNLTECVVLVCSLVQLLKNYIDINPLWINLIASSIVTIIRVVVVGDFSLGGIVLGLSNLIPILLGATGAYEVIKNLGKSLT